MQGKKYILYSYFRSSTSWRVRIALNYKQIPYDFKFIHLVKGQQKSEEYLKVNPNGAVPALVVAQGQTLIQSMAICEYLEDTCPENALLPKNPLLKSQIRGFCEIINSAIHPYQNLRLLEKVNKEFQADKMKFAKEWVVKGMEVLEKMLSKTRGKYCFGDQITLADVFLVPHAQGGSARFGVDLAEYPIIKEIVANLQQNEAFHKAQPKNQPDFE